MVTIGSEDLRLRGQEDTRVSTSTLSVSRPSGSRPCNSNPEHAPNASEGSSTHERCAAVKVQAGRLASCLELSST